MVLYGPLWLGRINFQNRSSQTAGKSYFEFGISKQQSHAAHLSNRIYKKCVKYSFLSRDSQKAQKCCFQIGFANKVFLKKAILLIFKAELTESAHSAQKILSY